MSTWPAEFPKQCPPKEAVSYTGKLYRFYARGSAPKDKDFLSFFPSIWPDSSFGSQHNERFWWRLKLASPIVISSILLHIQNGINRAACLPRLSPLGLIRGDRVHKNIVKCRPNMALSNNKKKSLSIK